MTESSSQPTRKFRGKLTRTTLLLLLPLTLIPVTVLGIITLFNTGNFLRSQITAQFSNVAETQADQINYLVARSQDFIATIATDPPFIRSLDTLLATDPASSEFEDVKQNLLSDYERLSRDQERLYFNHFVIVTPERKIAASTNPLWEGDLMDQKVYDELLTTPISLGLYNIYPFYTQYTNRLLVFTSRPLYDESGIPTATLVGINDSDDLLRILEIGQLSHPQARTYYITSPSREAVFVGLSPTADDLTAFSPSFDHIETVMPKIFSDNKEGVVEFASFNNTPVLGFTKWIPSIDAALVLEVPQSAISAPVQRSAYLQIILLVSALLFLGIVIWQGTRRIVKPILEVAQTAQDFADGDRQARAVVNRNDEIGLLAFSFNQVADQLIALYQSLESLVDARTQQIRTAAEVAQFISSAKSLDEVLSQTVNLIAERFKHYHTAIYIIDRGGDYAVLRQAAGAAAEETTKQGLRLAVGSRSIIGNVAASNRTRIAYDVKQDPYYLEAETLLETQSEVAIPLSIGGQVLGVLDVQSNHLNAFEEEEITTLQTLAGQIASAIQNVRLLENIRVDLQSTNILFQTSHQLADASSVDEVFQILGDILLQMPLTSTLFRRSAGQLQGLATKSDLGSTRNKDVSIPVTRDAISQIIATLSWDILSTEAPSDQSIYDLTDHAASIGCQAFTLMPLMSGDNFVGLVLLGATNQTILSPTNLQPYNSIVEMTNTAIEKIEAIEAITVNLAELQSLNTISEAISMETEMQELFAILHRQITQALGDINFLIALYDADTQLIEIPYMDEDGEIVSIPSFPLGQGLTSIVIRTQQPLMIIEDTVNRARALGAIVTSDRPAQSWLGVPMMVGGEVVGALVVQDTEQEYRFDEDDLRLLTTLAGQVAPTVRNTRLLAEAQEASERDRQLYQITDHIRNSNSMQDILETTVRELSQVLNLKRATIELAIDPTPLESRGNGKEEETE